MHFIFTVLPPLRPAASCEQNASTAFVVALSSPALPPDLEALLQLPRGSCTPVQPAFDVSGHVCGTAAAGTSAEDAPPKVTVFAVLFRAGAPAPMLLHRPCWRLRVEADIIAPFCVAASSLLLML